MSNNQQRVFSKKRNALAVLQAKLFRLQTYSKVIASALIHDAGDEAKLFRLVNGASFHAFRCNTFS